MGECCLDSHNFILTISISITMSIPISIPIIPINGGGGFHTGEGCGKFMVWQVPGMMAHHSMEL